MTERQYPRDYSLIGRDTRYAEEHGLAAAQWFQVPIPRKRLKELIQRRDSPAIRDTIVWFAAFFVTGGLACFFWPTWWSLPFFLAYGVLYGSSSDSRWHECGHGTAFRTQWMNDIVYHIACFMIMRNPTAWRWSHTRHHTDTLVVGRDPEIAVMRPTMVLKVIAMFFAIPQTFDAIRKMLIYASGRIPAEEQTFIPDMERYKAVLVARIWLVIHLAVVALAVSHGLHRAHAAGRAAADDVRRLGSCHDRHHPAWRSCRGCSRSPPQQPHRPYEPCPALHLLEHELPYRASHVPDGSLPCPAPAA